MYVVSRKGARKNTGRRGREEGRAEEDEVRECTRDSWLVSPDHLIGLAARGKLTSGPGLLGMGSKWKRNL